MLQVVRSMRIFRVFGSVQVPLLACMTLHGCALLEDGVDLDGNVSVTTKMIGRINNQGQKARSGVDRRSSVGSRWGSLTPQGIVIDELFA